MLLFCLGPRDLGEEVNEFRKAVAENNREEITALATELMDRIPDEEGVPDVEKSIYAQANNRIFGVVFWFALLGPVGAWLFRVADLMRRRALLQRARTSEDTADVSSIPIDSVLLCYRIMAWVPSRLLMVGYAMAGNYNGALAAWRKPPPEYSDGFHGPDFLLLGVIGCGAAEQNDAADISERAQVAMDLVIRTLWMVWCPVLALLTVYGALS